MQKFPFKLSLRYDIIKKNHSTRMWWNFWWVTSHHEKPREKREREKIQPKKCIRHFYTEKSVIQRNFVERNMIELCEKYVIIVSINTIIFVACLFTSVECCVRFTFQPNIYSWTCLLHKMSEKLCVFDQQKRYYESVIWKIEKNRQFRCISISIHVSCSSKFGFKEFVRVFQ